MKLEAPRPDGLGIRNLLRGIYAQLVALVAAAQEWHAQARKAPLDAVLALSPAQVGLLIGVSESAVFKMLAKGELPVVVIKNKQRILRSDLLKWLEDRERLLPGEVIEERVAS